MLSHTSLRPVLLIVHYRHTWRCSACRVQNKAGIVVHTWCSACRHTADDVPTEFSIVFALPGSVAMTA